jgi:undecaprenyl-diphosphatase
MDLTYLVKAAFLGIIEGMTEFLPVSSTGHLILIGDWIAFKSDDAKVFEIVIQLGAVLAVCWLYRTKLIDLIRGGINGGTAERRFAGVVILAFLPAAVLGALFISAIKALLFNPTVVAAARIAGGIIILMVERYKGAGLTQDTKQISWRQALSIGAAQCIAMIPGTSRSGATIVGGMLSGLSRQTATEFSFFLAMPTMLGAASYDLFRHHHLLSQNDFSAIAVGFVMAFVSALLVVTALVRFIARHSFRVFAWYRIGLGLAILLWLGISTT